MCWRWRRWKVKSVTPLHTAGSLLAPNCSRVEMLEANFSLHNRQTFSNQWLTARTDETWFRSDIHANVSYSTWREPSKQTCKSHHLLNIFPCLILSFFVEFREREKARHTRCIQVPLEILNFQMLASEMIFKFILSIMLSRSVDIYVEYCRWLIAEELLSPIVNFLVTVLVLGF